MSVVEEDSMELCTEQDEPNKSSGNVVWTLDLEEFNDTVFSPPLYVRNLPWYVDSPLSPITPQ